MANSSRSATSPVGFSDDVLSAIGEGGVDERRNVDNGYVIEAVPSFRGNIRVWRATHTPSGATWYVKRASDDRTFRRHLVGLSRLANAAPASLAIPRLVGTHERWRLVATEALDGIVVSDRFVSATRLDKLFRWGRSNLDGLADVLVRGFRALRTARTEPIAALMDYSPQATADRIDAKSDRLRGVIAGSHARLHDDVSRASRTLRSLQRDRSWLLGDADLSNMLDANGCLGLVDLDDVGTGDWLRDTACVLQHLADLDGNRKYATSRVARFRQRFLHGLGVDSADRLIVLYRVEFQLDYLWSAAQRGVDSDLPAHGRSVQSVEAALGALLRQLA